MELTINKSKTFSNTDIGNFSQILKDAPSGKVSKQFTRDLLGLTGMEVSVTAYPPDTATPFFHTHKQNEELYIVIKGEGQMHLDNELIDVREGSFVRILPECSRSIKSGPDSELIFLCIQSKLDSLEQCTRDDGVRQDREFGQITK
jgi:mannose-6-phosphate isomerase-like protein (cupin superfamily)